MARKADPDDLRKLVEIMSSNITHAGSDIQSMFLQPELFETKLSGKVKCPTTNVETRKVSTVAEVTDAINEAKELNKIVRCAGSSHAPEDHIIGPDESGLLLILTGDLQKVTVDRENSTEDNLYVTAGGGCYLGYSPEKEGGEWESSLCYAVDQEGFALPILGGISHQSVAGFMMTGSAGGSLKYGFADIIEEINFVNGNGIPWNCSKENDAELFHAVGVSMGLFGVITSVKFCLVDKKFNVKGKEENVEFSESFLSSATELDESLKDSNNDYYHINWFPQKYVNSVMQWTGHRVLPADAEIDPYVHTLQDPCKATGAALMLMTSNLILECDFVSDLGYKFIGFLLGQFVPLDSPQEFCDFWYRALPNDDLAPVDTIFKVDFTEVWVPRDQYAVVLQKLNDLYDDSDDGQQAAGNFATEIYCAKESPFWLSMSYDEDMLRIDPYWFHCNPKGDKRTFYSYVWDTLLDIVGSRLHWGKWLPLPNQICGSTTFNLEYLKKSYEKMDSWLLKREEMDPHQVFVNKYWRGILEIPPK